MSSIQFGLKKTLFSVGYYSYLSLQYLILVSLKTFQSINQSIRKGLK